MGTHSATAAEQRHSGNTSPQQSHKHHTERNKPGPKGQLLSPHGRAWPSRKGKNRILKSGRRAARSLNGTLEDRAAQACPEHQTPAKETEVSRSVSAMHPAPAARGQQASSAFHRWKETLLQHTPPPTQQRRKSCRKSP